MGISLLTASQKSNNERNSLIIIVINFNENKDMKKLRHFNKVVFIFDNFSYSLLNIIKVNHIY